MPLNFSLLSSWQNWARVLLMVMIAGIAFDLLARGLTFKKGDNNG